MRGWLLLLLLVGCRTRPLDEAPEVADLAHPSDLVDLAHSPDAPCSPRVPDGYCAPGTSCCPYSCWGGNDVTGWCSPGDGCPLC